MEKILQSLSHPNPNRKGQFHPENESENPVADVSKRSCVLPDALHPYTFISREEPCCQHGSLQPSCRFSHVANSSEIRTAIQHQPGLPHTTRKSNTTRAYSHYFPTRCSISANMLVSSLFRSINAPRNRNVDFCGWRNAQPLLTARVL